MHINGIYLFNNENRLLFQLHFLINNSFSEFFVRESTFLLHSTRNIKFSFTKKKKEKNVKFSFIFMYEL